MQAEKLHNDTTVVRERVIDAFCNALEHDLITYDWEHKNVLQDSTFFSRTLAHNGDNPYALEKFNQLITRLPVFTLSIILTANINIRQERLRSRIATNPNVVSPDDMLVINNPNKFLKKEEALIYHTHRVFKSQIIDTSDTSAKEVAEIILKQL